MKKWIIFILFFITSTSLISSAEIKYIDITNYSNPKIIGFKNFEDFQNLMISHEIQTFYRIGTNDEIFKPDSSNSRVIMIIDDIWYSFTTKGYKTIHDYTEGIRKGFKNATDYYYCLEHNISSFDNLSKMKRYLFLTEADYLDAIDLGIIDIIKEDTLSDSNNLSFTADKAREDYLNTAKKTNIVIKYPETITKSFYETIIIKLEYGSFQRNRRFEGYSGRSESDYKLQNDNYILREKDKTISIDEFSLGYLYYFMKLEGFSDLKKYLLFSKAEVGGYKNINDYHSSISSGFDNSESFYKAISKGFLNNIDFEEASGLGINSFIEYKDYKIMMTEFDNIIQTYGMSPGYEVILIKLLQDLEPESKVRINDILSDYRKFIRKYQNIERIRLYKKNMTTYTMESWFSGNRMIESLGEYNKVDKSFIRKF